MALESQMGGSGALFIGEDKVCRLELLDAAGVPVDMTGWTVVLAVAKNDKAPRADWLIDKAATIEGVYDAVRATNTQRAVVQLDDDDLPPALFKAKTEPPHYRYGWARTDDGSNTMLAYGDFVLEKNPALPDEA